jgi:hypothetical protein
MKAEILKTIKAMFPRHVSNRKHGKHLGKHREMDVSCFLTLSVRKQETSKKGKAMIPQHTKQRIKDAAQIYDVVAQFVSLKRSGKRYKALCPFHEERTPSFCVTPSKGIYRCFGCGKGGDAVAFLMEYNRMKYPDALRYLAAMYNIETEEAPGRPTQHPAPKIAPRPKTPPPAAPPSFIPKSDFRQSLKEYDKNNFAAFLVNRFGKQTAADLIGRYAIGTAKGGKALFFYIDSRGNVRSGKRMRYNPITGKRIRTEDKKDATFIHTGEFNYVPCWYGEHLLPKRPGAPVAIVESEKSAILASLYLPAFVWLAVGGSGLPKSPDGWKVLEGRRIVLYPDCDPPDKDGKTPFQKWSEHADALRKLGYNIAVSDLLESTATDAIRANKYDLADYLLKYDPADFPRAKEAHSAAPQPAQGANASTAAPIPTAQPEAVTGQMQAPTGAAEYQRFTDRHTGETFTQIITPEGYPAAWDDPTADAEPPAVLSAKEAAELMTRYQWEAVGTWQPLTDAAPDVWPDLPDLMTFFADHTPTAPVRLDAATLMTDPAAFIASHLMTVQRHNGKRAYLPYLERLRALKRLMEAA